MDDLEKDKDKKDESGVPDDDITRCLNEKDEYLNGWKRAKAELVNYKKDELKRFESILKFGQEGLMKELLAVLDSFDLAVASDDKTQEKGALLIRQQFEDVLKKNGLERIRVSVGDDFDPAHHEAIVQVESDASSGKIVEVVSSGYILNGRVIRRARVKIAK